MGTVLEEGYYLLRLAAFASECPRLSSDLMAMLLAMWSLGPGSAAVSVLGYQG
jgi:hypothetical protein